MSICTSSDNASSTSMDSIEMQNRLLEIEEEQAKLKQLQSQLASTFHCPAPAPISRPSFKTISPEEQAQADGRSVHVANVDYSCTSADLEQHFSLCGSIARVTIPRDKFSGNAKGFAYVEFVDAEGRANAIAMEPSMLKGRQIKVTEKRTNLPGISTTNRFPRQQNLNRVQRGHGGAIVKYVPVYGGGRNKIVRRPNM